MSCDIGPVTSSGGEERKENEYFIAIFQPHGTYDMVLVTTAKEPVKVTYRFE